MAADLKIYAGADETLTFTVVDNDDATIDQATLATMTFALNLMPVGTASVILSGSGTATADSEVSVSFTDAETAPLDAYHLLAYQLIATLGTDTDVVDEGTVEIGTLGVTGTPAAVLAPLAAPADLARFGYSTDAATMLSRASARVRGYVRQDITAGTDTVVVDYPFLLPQRPVTGITSVYDADGEAIDSDGYTRRGAYLVLDAVTSPITVTYSYGFSTLPDELVEVVCSVAARMHAASASLTQGIRSEQAGGEMLTYGTDAYQGVASLTAAEKAVIDRIYPRLPSVAVLA